VFFNPFQYPLRVPQIAFPNPHDPPASCTQYPIHRVVAVPIPKNFFPPICPSGFWYVATLGTAVPKASIHEYCQTCLLKYKIWFAEHRLIATPARDATPPEQFRQCQFCIIIAATPNSRHPFRSLFSGEEVGHAQRPSKYQIKNSSVSAQDCPYA
jgi:hypothetical protein